MSELKLCKVCGGKVDWCHECDGCHFIVCESCKSVFDLSQCEGVDGDTLEGLRSSIAGIWNSHAALPDDLSTDVLALCEALEAEEQRTMVPGDQHNPLIEKVRERLRGSDGIHNNDAR